MIGPDAQRYLHLAKGHRVPRPFCLRWLLPTYCGTDVRLWRAVWFGSWVTVTAAMFWLSQQTLDGWARPATATVLLLGLPGILGPDVVNPVGVDLPATAVALCTAAFAAAHNPHWVVAAAICAAVAGSIKETAPVFAALWAWSPWPLIGLAAPAARWLWVRWRHLEGPDPLGPEFQHIARHPVRSALAAHQHIWRNGWVMLAPWGMCLVALWRPDWQTAAVLAVAYAQLIVATDTVRLLHHAAGPVLAIGAAQRLPADWLLLAAAAHTFWLYRAERV